MATVRYTLTVYIDRHVEADEDPNAYIANTECYRLEKELVHALRTFDGDVDCEVMTTEIITD